MNILLVTYSFPPAAGVGVLRALSLAKYLPQSGLNVQVLTARNAASVGLDARPLKELPDSVSIHRTWTPDLPFALRKALKKFVSKRSETSGPVSREAPRNGSSSPRQRSRMKTLLGNLLLPDPQVGWIPFALRRAEKILKSGPIDLVLITVPPFSAAQLATRLRSRHPNLPIVLDFRDEWLTSTIKLVSFNSNNRAVRIATETERDAVKAATFVVCATERAVIELRSRYPEQAADKFRCIPNGFDRVPPSESELRQSIRHAEAQNDGRVVITYIGSIYRSTDPSTVIWAVQQMPTALRNRVLLRFIGHIESEHHRQALLELGSQVELIGFVPQAEALQYIDSSTYLLLITHDPINVSAKLYDYLGSGRPILAAVHPEGDAKRILDETGSGLSADVSDGKAITEMLVKAVEIAGKLSEDYSPNLNKIASYQRHALAARYAAVLRALKASDQPS